MERNTKQSLSKPTNTIIIMRHLALHIRILIIALTAATAMQARTIKTTIDDFDYSLDTDTRTATVTGINVPLPHALDIPAKVTYQQAEFTVTEIAGSAFEWKRSLTTITLPATLTKIGERAFAECTSLTHIFCYMETPVALNADSVYWGDVPPSECTIHVMPGKAEAYRQADVWNKFQHIEENLSTVKIEEINHFIYFLDGTKQTAAVMKRDYYYGGKIVIPGKVISDGVEYTVTAIEHGAFYSPDRDNYIESITLPEGLAKIGQYALYGLYDKPIYSYAVTPPEVYENSFYESHDISNTLHVKPGTGDAYRNADVWKNFTNIAEDLTTGIGDTMADVELDGSGLTVSGTAWTVCTVDGRIVAQGTGKKRLCLPAGIYVARCGNTAKKLRSK